MCISGIDLIIGICMFLSSWPIPRGTPGIHAAIGTTSTCTAQGFFLQFAIMAPLYNAALSLYYLLMIRYNWTEERLQKLRLPIHATILTFGLGTSIAGLPLTLYNNSNLWCWQASYPVGCLESSQNNGVTTCERGDNALSIYRWAFFYAPLWAAIVFATISMLLVFCKVHSLEVKSERFRSTRYSMEQGVMATNTCGNSAILQRPGARAEKVARQACCYVGAFYLTWIWSTLTRIIQTISGRSYFPIVLLTAIFLPSNGFLNFCVYTRPRFERYREQHPDWSIRSALRQFCRNIYFTPITRAEDQQEADDDYNVALTEAEMRSIFVTEELDREADDYNKAVTEAETNRVLSSGVERPMQVSFQEHVTNNESIDD